MRKHVAVLSVATLLCCLLSIGHSLRNRPWNDEGAMASPAVTLLKQGKIATMIYEDAGADQPDGDTQRVGVHEHTYYLTPLYFLAQAVWYLVIPFSLLSMRLLSLFFGLVLALSTFGLIRKLTDDIWTATVGASILLLDYYFLICSSMGRMDMMSSALGFAGLAAFVHLRERSFMKAVLVSNTCIALSMLTHPIGVTHAFGWLALAWMLDRRRLGWRAVALAGVPYLVGGALYGCYILQNPHDSYLQFRGNALMLNRLQGFQKPWMALWLEVTSRYGTAYGMGGHSEGHSGPIFLKALILLGYLIGVAGCAAIRSVRRLPGAGVMLVLLAVHALSLAVVDSIKHSFYLIHVLPLYAAVLAVLLVWFYRTYPRLRILEAVAVLGFIALQTGGIAYKIKLNTYGNNYLTAVRYLKQNMGPGSMVNGSADLAFEFGFFQEQFFEDTRMGYHSGRRPEFIVVEETMRTGLDGHRLHRPRVDAYVRKLLTEEYEMVYDRTFYQIYRRKASAARN